MPHRIHHFNLSYFCDCRHENGKKPSAGDGIPSFTRIMPAKRSGISGKHNMPTRPIPTLSRKQA